MCFVVSRASAHKLLKCSWKVVLRSFWSFYDQSDFNPFKLLFDLSCEDVQRQTDRQTDRQTEPTSTRALYSMDATIVCKVMNIWVIYGRSLSIQRNTYFTNVITVFFPDGFSPASVSWHYPDFAMTHAYNPKELSVVGVSQHPRPKRGANTSHFGTFWT